MPAYDAIYADTVPPESPRSVLPLRAAITRQHYFAPDAYMMRHDRMLISELMRYFAAEASWRDAYAARFQRPASASRVRCRHAATCFRHAITPAFALCPLFSMTDFRFLHSSARSFVARASPATDELVFHAGTTACRPCHVPECGESSDGPLIIADRVDRLMPCRAFAYC